MAKLARKEGGHSCPPNGGLENPPSVGDTVQTELGRLPAEWSLLSHTLPELLHVSPPCSNPSIEDVQVTISSLGIPSDDIAQLRKIALFPDEPADFLFSITVGYLLQVNISEDTLSIVLDHLLRISGLTDRPLMSISTENVSDIAIYADIQTSLINEFRVNQFPYTDIITTSYSGASAVTWGDIATITERSIIERLGFSIRGLKAIQYIWQLKEHAFELEKVLSKGLPVAAFDDFERLVDAFVRTIAERERDYFVLKGRLGLLDGRKWTLEELGQRENLTRERIRQIEQKVMSTLQKRHATDRLNRMWLALDETLMTCGGVCSITEIAESLGNRWKWPTHPSDDSLASLISLSANYEVVWDSPIRVIMPKHACVNCSEIGRFLTRTVTNQRQGILSLKDTKVEMQEFCRSHCAEASAIARFSNGYLHFLADTIEDILADEAAVYSEYAWAQKYGKQRMILVETILRNAGRPMHFTEVHVEVNKDRLAQKQLSERNIYSYIERSPDLLLWDRGTYIHRDHVSIPLSLIREIEDNIICRLQES